MSTEPNKGDIVERCKRTASAMSRTSPDSGIDICHITTVNEAAAEIRALRSQVADLTAQRDAMVRATEELFFAMDQWRSGGMRVEGVQLAEKELRTALALCKRGGGE